MDQAGVLGLVVGFIVFGVTSCILAVRYALLNDALRVLTAERRKADARLAGLSAELTTETGRRIQNGNRAARAEATIGRVEELAREGQVSPKPLVEVDGILDTIDEWRDNEEEGKS